jgi:hypothetical protein
MFHRMSTPRGPSMVLIVLSKYTKKQLQYRKMNKFFLLRVTLPCLWKWPKRPRSWLRLVRMQSLAIMKSFRRIIESTFIPAVAVAIPTSTSIPAVATAAIPTSKKFKKALLNAKDYLPVSLHEDAAFKKTPAKEREGSDESGSERDQELQTTRGALRITFSGFANCTSVTEQRRQGLN